MFDIIAGSLDLYKNIIESIFSAVGSSVPDDMWSVFDSITGSVAGSLSE